MVWIVPLAPLFDALENVTSFVMLADPAGFADWLAYPYSTFAVVKFALFGIGYLWALASLVIVLAFGIWWGATRLRPASSRDGKNKMKRGIVDAS